MNIILPILTLLSVFMVAFSSYRLGQLSVRRKFATGIREILSNNQEEMKDLEPNVDGAEQMGHMMIDTLRSVVALALDIPVEEMKRTERELADLEKE